MMQNHDSDNRQKIFWKIVSPPSNALVFYDYENMGKILVLLLLTYWFKNFNCAIERSNSFSLIV